MRRILIIAGAALAILIGAALVLPLLVDVNRYRDLIQTKATEALGREVSLGEMSLTVFPAFGIRVNEPGVEGLLCARSLTVGVRLFPLLFGGTVDVTKVSLDHPEIALTRGRDGAWNFEEPEGQAGTVSHESGQGEAAARPFTVSRIQIVAGIIHLRDESQRAGPPVALAFTLDLTGSAGRSEAGDLEVSLDGELRGEGLRLDLRGGLSRSAPPGGRTSLEMTVRQADIEVARARELAAALGQPWPVPEGILKSRSLKISGRLTGEFDTATPARFALADVVVEGADLGLSRDRGGRWNFESLMGEPGPGRGAVPSGSTPAFQISNLKVDGARIALHDEATAGSGAVDLVFEDLRLSIDELVPERPTALRIETKVTPGRGVLSLQGTLPLSLEGGKEASIDAEADLRDIEARAVGPYLDSLLGIGAESGTISAQIKMKGTWPRRLEASGTVALDDLKATGAPRVVTAKAQFGVTATEGAARLEISRLEVSTGRSRLEVRGTVDNRGAGSLVDLEIPPSSLDATDLNAFIVLAGAASPVEFSSSQPVRLQARVRGDVKMSKSLEMSGSIAVADFTLRHPLLDKPLEKVKGTVTLRRDGFDVSGFAGVIGASDLAGTLSLTGFDAPRITFAMASRHADFWEMMSFLKEEPAGQEARTGGAAAPASGEDGLSRVSARGTLEIGDGSFGTLAFTGLTSTVALDGKVMRLDPVGMKLYSGTMTGSATLDMARDPAVYSVSAVTRELDTDALLTANLQMKGALTGALSGDLSITTSGASRDAALANARGTGQVKIGDGHVGAINVLKILSRASDVLGERSLKEVSGRLAKEGTDFSELTADLRVAGGKIVSDRLRMTSPDLELKDDGELDMMAGTLRVAGQIIFSQALSQAMVEERSRAVDYFWDDKRGRVNLPVTLSGPIEAPTPSIDWGSAGGKLAGRKVREQVGERIREAGLGDLLGDRAGKSPVREGSGESGAGPDPQAMAPTGALSIAIEESGFSGNFLMPDLKVKGTLRGSGISAASVKVTDEKGRVLAEESLAEKINKYYAGHDRSAPAAINFRVTVDGGKMAGSRKGVRVEITVSDDAGRAATKTVEVER
ncbi:MAG TPA: AsmA family protein [Candidatus Polarisedimenticolia bacterium]